MAEVVGLVVGLASFGIQLIESTKKIKTLCADIKDAPAELQDTIEGIEIMSEIMMLMGPLDSQPHAERAALNRSIELCQRALDRLIALTGDLQNRLRGNDGIRGRLSVVFRKGSMDRLIARLEQCKGLLQLAHQLYMGARNMSRLEVHERSLDELHQGQVTLISQCMTKLVCQAPPVEDFQTGQMQLPTNIENATSTLQRRRPSDYGQSEVAMLQRPILSLRFRTPWWSYSRVLQLTMAQVPAGWTASLKFYRIVHWLDPFLEACRRDDLDTVKELLEARKANVCDINIVGDTGVDLALEYGGSKVSKYLYQHGCPVAINDESVYICWTTLLERSLSNRILTEKPSCIACLRASVGVLE